MSSPHKLNVKNEQLWLSYERCIFWENNNSLILSDLHFGKTGHFRKYGIAVPQDIFQEDLDRLLTQIKFFDCNSLIIVGDLFHSHANKEMDLFLKWRKENFELKIHLVKGNHDILRPSFYKKADLEIFKDVYSTFPFCFIHDISQSCNTTDKSEPYTFSGHTHPGIRLNGIGRQSLQFPCFHFLEHYAILPAFSKFTGLSNVNREQGDRIFALVEKSIVEV